MNENLFELITWPDIQYYMGLEGFDENSYIINDEKGIEEYGSSAYFVRASWALNALKEVHKMLQEIYDEMLEDSQTD